MKTKLALLGFLILISLGGFGQVTMKYSLCGFSSLNLNDTIILSGGQSMSGESNNPSVKHGYLPLNYSTLNNGEFSPLNLNIYPNPSLDILQIDFNENFSGEIIITDISGRPINNFLVEGTHLELDISLFSSGAYLIHFSRGKVVLLTQIILKL